MLPTASLIENVNVTCFSNIQVLQNLGKDKFPPQSFEQVGTRIAKVLEKVRAPMIS